MSREGIMTGVRSFTMLWQVISKLVTLTVILIMLSVAHTDFQMIVVGGFILLYASVISILPMLDRLIMEQQQERLSQFVELSKMLNYEHVEYFETKNNDLKKHLDKRGSSITIDGVFYVLFVVMALFIIVGAMT